MAVVTEKRITERLRDEMPLHFKHYLPLGRPEDKDKRGEEVRALSPWVKLCLERVRLVTEAYKETEGEPMILRRAKALANILDNMTIYILPHERLVGNYASDTDAMVHFPELSWRWLDKGIEKEYRDLLDDKGREELHQIHKYWQNKASQGMERNLVPDEVKPYWFWTNHGVFYWQHGGKQGVANFQKVLQVGLNGIIRECEQRLKQIDTDPNIYLHAREYLEQKRFLEAAIITLQAGIRWGKRFSNLAREMAERENNEGRRKELEEIARICDWVPGNPARTFPEALQSYWFIHLITRELELQTNGSGERLDQLLYPFYKKDNSNGTITRDEAQDLIEFLILKINESNILAPAGFTTSGGNLITQRQITIGGVTSDGEDATNEMSYIIMDAKIAMGFVIPTIEFRYHNQTPKRLINKAAELLRKVGGGHIAFFNDGFMIPYLVNLGIPIEDARNYGLEGCLRWGIEGKAMGHRNMGGTVVLPRCLELALLQGVDKVTSKQVGVRTADPLTFTSIEDVMQAYLEQISFFTQKLVAIYNITDVVDEELCPQPFLSSLLDGCIEHGQHHRRYHWFPKTIIQPVGHITVANSLAVIKKLVFDDKSITMAELIDAIMTNWDGKEDLRQKCLNVPKFGNDEDEVDSLARDSIIRSTEVMQGFKNIYGGHFLLDGTSGSRYFDYSGLTGATPDGRKDRDLFNDGTISPAIGTDKKGPTAVLKSVGKVDCVRSFNHLLNQKIAPQLLGEEFLDLFDGYLRTWADLGIHHIQFNVIDKQILLDAQQNPEKYPLLTIRVAGYCAYWIDLQKEVQDQILDRTEQVFG
ncbi:MAG: pyruvate formate lyase family protein [Chloroflexota bacterium]|nr:pyruvate formate lyase family protein [Chloroflexota bacterium]